MSNFGEALAKLCVRWWSDKCVHCGDRRCCDGVSVEEVNQIKAEKPVTVTCDANDLVLSQAKKENGTWLTENEVLSGVGPTGRTVLMAMGAELAFAGLSEEDVSAQVDHREAAKGNGPIHVLVDVPGCAGSEAIVTGLPSIDVFGNFVATEIKKAFEARATKRPIYLLSDLDSEHQERMAKKMRLSHEYVTFDEPTPSSDERILPYTWLDVLKDADTQRTNYTAYLETHLKTVLDEKDLSWLDVAKDETLLSVSDPRLPLSMRGTSDVLLVDRRSIQNLEPLAVVRTIVELKKKVEPHHKPQAFGELVSASLKAPLNCSPIGLLTDLNDQWPFSWFNENSVLTHVNIVHPKNAFDFIAAATAAPGSSKPFRVPFIDRPLTEFLLERRREYAVHLVQSTPMYAHMYE